MELVTALRELITRRCLRQREFNYWRKWQENRDQTGAVEDAGVFPSNGFAPTFATA